MKLPGWLQTVDNVIARLEAWYYERNMEPTPTVQPPVQIAPVPPTVPEFPPEIVAWAQAIGIEEGAKPELNNPGNLKYSTLTASWGASKGFQATDGGWIAKFSTLSQGTKALCNFLVLGCENQLVAFHSPEARTLGGFTKIYAGNPPEAYIIAIGLKLNKSLDVQISTFLGSSL